MWSLDDKENSYLCFSVSCIFYDNYWFLLDSSTMVTFSIMFTVAIGMTRWLNLQLQLALYCEFNLLCRADASHCCKILTTKRVGWMMQKQPSQSSSCYLQFNNTSWWSLNCTRFHLQDSCTSAAGLLLNATRFLQKTVQDSPSSPAPSLHPAATVSQVAKATHNLRVVLRLNHTLPPQWIY